MFKKVISEPTKECRIGIEIEVGNDEELGKVVNILEIYDLITKPLRKVSAVRIPIKDVKKLGRVLIEYGEIHGETKD